MRRIRERRRKRIKRLKGRYSPEIIPKMRKKSTLRAEERRVIF
jgi:hypothetical protein